MWYPLAVHFAHRQVVAQDTLRRFVAEAKHMTDLLMGQGSLTFDQVADSIAISWGVMHSGPGQISKLSVPVREVRCPVLESPECGGVRAIDSLEGKRIAQLEERLRQKKSITTWSLRDILVRQNPDHFLLMALSPFSKDFCFNVASVDIQRQSPAHWHIFGSNGKFVRSGGDRRKDLPHRWRMLKKSSISTPVSTGGRILPCQT
jgi:hypothetical protein